MLQNDHSPTTKRLSSSDLFALTILRGATFSPDASLIAVSTSYVENVEKFAIWIADRDGERKLRVPHEGKASSPVWSPDGKIIAFNADGRLRTFGLESAAVSEPLTPEGTDLAGAPCWAKDGTEIAVCLNEYAKSVSPAISRYHYKADGVGRIDGLRRTIHILAMPSGQALHRIDCAHFLSDPKWNPDGDRLLFVASNQFSTHGESTQELLIWNRDDRSITKLCDTGWYIQSARWSANGRNVVIAGSYRSEQAIPNTALWSLDLETGAQECVTESLKYNVGSRILSDLPCRELTSGVQIIPLSSGEVLATVQRRGAAEVRGFDLGADSQSRLISGEGQASHLLLDVSESTSSVLIAVASVMSPPELWMIDLGTAVKKKITGFTHRAIEKWPAVELVKLECISKDALAIDCWFLGPAARKAPIPTILYIHPGPFVATGHAFRFDFHLLASHGFGIVFHNFRGSAGYGKSFTEAIAGDWGARAFPDHRAAIEAAVTEKLADPSRLGVWGQSHGGFATCWVVSHCDLFAAAIAEAAFTDLTSLYYTTDLPDPFAADLGGKPHEIPDIYRSRSPITYAHRCKTPTMLLHGENDCRCPIDQAERFYRALVDAQCTSELVIMPGATHLSDSIGSLGSRQLQNESLVRWFTAHIGAC